MSNVIRFNNPRKALDEMREQACVWLVKLDAGASEEEMQKIRAWLDADPEHAKILLEVACMWDQVSVLSELSEIFPLGQYVQSRSVSNRRSFGIAAMAVAVIAAVMVGGMSLVRTGNPSVIEPVRETMARTYETRIGQQSTVILPDDSEIILNTNTLLEVSYSAAERNVILLRGEGHFSVSKDPGRPFRVHAGDSVIEAVGTAFAVQHIEEEDVEVTVTEGKVSFSHTLPAQAAQDAAERPDATAGEARNMPQQDSMPVIAGESASVNGQDETIQKRTIEPEEMEEKLAWRQGRLLFQGDSLEDVIKEVSRYTSIRFEVDDAIRNIEVFGYFRAGDVDGLLLTMRETFHVNVERVNDDYIYLSSQ